MPKILDRGNLKEDTVWPILSDGSVHDVVAVLILGL